MQNFGELGLFLVGNSFGEQPGKIFKQAAHLINQLLAPDSEEKVDGTTVCGVLFPFYKTLSFKPVKDPGHVGRTLLDNITELILGQGLVAGYVLQQMKLLCCQIIGIEEFSP